MPQPRPGRRITPDCPATDRQTPPEAPDQSVPPDLSIPAGLSDSSDEAGGAEGADEADAPEPETGPLRRCIVTRERLPRQAMIRFVIGPDRQLVPDLAARLPGRGIWLSARWDVVETARSRGGFARAARGQVTVPATLMHDLKAALARRIGDTLGLARRAGQAVCGFTKAREWLASGRAGLVVQASDGSAEERRRFLSGRAGGDGTGGDGTGGGVPAVVTPLDGAALGAVFGRDHAVHVAVARGRLAEILKTEAGRLAGLTMQNDDARRAAKGPTARSPGATVSATAGPVAAPNDLKAGE